MAKLRRPTKKWPTIRSLSLEEGEHRVNRGERDAALPPIGEAGGRAALVQAPGRILDEADPPSAGKHAEDRRVVADVRRNAEDEHLVGSEALEQKLCVRVREDVEVLLQEEELPALEVALGHEL